MNDMFLLQGLKNNTLVAGKTTAIRLFTDPWPITEKDVDVINAQVTRPDGSNFGQMWGRADFVIVPTSSKGQSIVVRIPGNSLPLDGYYDFNVQLINPIGGVAATYTARVNFLPTRDLRIVVSRLWSGTPEKPNEINAVKPAMERLAALLPIRDGVSTFDGDMNAGLRYVLDNNPAGPPNQDGHLCPLFAQYINRPAYYDTVDRGITYRFPNSGEGSGANSNHFCVGQNVPYCVSVWGAPLANVFIQETLHSFGMEHPSNPHFEISGHSKDMLIDTTEVDLGFDIQFNKPFPSSTYDVMFATGPDPGYPDEAHALNSFDWEYCRKQLLRLPPTPLKTNVAPTAVGVGTNIYFFVKNNLNRIFFNYAPFTKGAVGWAEMGGEGRTNTAIGAGAIGNYMFVTMRGYGGEIYLSQADRGAGRSFETWFPMNFTPRTDVAPSALGVGGSMYFFATGRDNKIYYNSAVLGRGAVGWKEMEGGGRTRHAPSGAAIGSYVFVAVRGLDGEVFVNQADKGAGTAFGSWQNLVFKTDAAPVAVGVGRSIYIFAKHPDGRIFYNHAVLGSGFAGWKEMEGGGRTDAAPGAGAIGSYVYVVIKGLDNNIYLNQADKGAGTPFGSWQAI